MDGVSFSPVSSSSLQRQAGNQICHYRSPLACYGNKARHMCFCLCVCVRVCLFVCGSSWGIGGGGGEGERCEKGDESLSLKGVHIYHQQHTDPIERSNVDHKNSTFHPGNISTTLIMFTYIQISPLNKIFHPGFWVSTLKISTLSHNNPG